MYNNSYKVILVHLQLLPGTPSSTKGWAPREIRKTFGVKCTMLYEQILRHIFIDFHRNMIFLNLKLSCLYMYMWYHVYVYVYIYTFQTGCQLSSAASGMSLELWFFLHNFSGVKRSCWTTSSWWSCLSLEVVSSIPAGSTIIYRFLCGFMCVSLCQSIKIKSTNI